MSDQEELMYLRDQIQIERDELTKCRHAAHLWSVVRSLLIEAGCPIETNCHIPTVVGDWLHCVSPFALQPHCIKKMVRSGWKFEWHSEARFVAAEHPLGGKQSIIDVCRTGRDGFDRDEIGVAITTLMNGSSEK